MPPYPVRIFLSRGLAAQSRPRRIPKTPEKLQRPQQTVGEVAVPTKRIGGGCLRGLAPHLIVFPRMNFVAALRRFMARQCCGKGKKVSRTVHRSGGELRRQNHTAFGRGQLTGGLGPREMHRHMHRRHASHLALHPGIVVQVAAEAIGQETVAAKRGFERFVTQVNAQLQSLLRGLVLRKPAVVSEQVASRNLDAVAQHVSYTGLWGAIRTFPLRRPFLTNFFLSVTGYAGADYCSQSMAGGGVDKQQVLTFAAFGAVQGCVSWGVYVKIFSKLNPGSIRFSNLTFAEKLRSRTGQMSVIKQVFLDNFVYTPWLFFPTFYACKAMFQGDHETPVVDIAQRGYLRYTENFVQDNIACCKVWIPADFLIYTVPAWMRMPLIQGVNFVFTMVLSRMRGASSSTVDSSTSETVDEKKNFSMNWSLQLPRHWTTDLLQMSPSV